MDLGAVSEASTPHKHTIDAMFHCRAQEDSLERRLIEVLG